MEYTLRCADCGHEQTFAFDSFESAEDEGFFYALMEEASEHGWEQIDGGWYCSDCWIVCDRCGEVEPARDSATVDRTETWCSDCVDRFAYECHDCGRYVSDNNVYFAYDGDRVLCSDCYDENYYYCERCDTTVHYSDWNSTYDCCRDCAERISNGRGEYHDSHYRPITHFVHGKAELTYNIEGGHFSDRSDDKRKRLESIRTFGFELEVDEGSNGAPDIDGCIEELRAWDTNGYIRAFEEDGSLSCDGLEIISNPMDKDTFDRYFDVAKFCSIIKSNNYCSHDASNMTSLHMHFNRQSFFGKTTARQTENLEKLYTFFAKNWDSLRKASRRKGNTYWCDMPSLLIPYCPEGSVCRKAWLADRRSAAEYNHSDHHMAINNGNADTVEIRIGRGTLNPVSFSAWVDFMWRVVTNMKHIPLNRADETELWLKGMKPSTLEYLRSRKAFTDVLGEPLVEVEETE